MDSITVCMATYPGRFGIVGGTVRRLLDQTVSPSRILLHVNESDVPPPLPDDPRIELFCSGEENLTDIGKFKMSSLVKSGVVVTVDDDLLYPRNYLERVSAALTRYDGRAIVGYHGIILPNGPPIRTWEAYLQKRQVYWFGRGLKKDLPVQILGTGTMAYCSETVSFDWESFDHLRMADLHVAVSAQKKGVPMVALSRKDRWLLPDPARVNEKGTPIWERVQHDSEMQNQMMDVLGRVEWWKLHLPGNRSGQ